MSNPKNSYKLDLHTHSIISHDGGLTEGQYTKLLADEVLDFIAITDHNETTFARLMQSKLGEKIIIGEEITSTDGEIIGLFLQKTIPGGLTAEETVKEIKAQDGIVYIPHPFETFRKGLQAGSMEQIAGDIDIVEIFNGRGRFRNKNSLSAEFVHKHDKTVAASSDAHCPLGIGKTYSIIEGVPTQANLLSLLGSGKLHKIYAPLLAFLCPAVNKLRNKLVVTR